MGNSTRNGHFHVKLPEGMEKKMFETTNQPNLDAELPWSSPLALLRSQAVPSPNSACETRPG